MGTDHGAAEDLQKVGGCRWMVCHVSHGDLNAQDELAVCCVGARMILGEQRLITVAKTTSLE